MSIHTMVKRRDFLRLASLAVGALVSRGVNTSFASGRYSTSKDEIDWKDETVSFNEVYHDPPLLGRVHGAARLRVFAKPEPSSKTSRTIYWGFVGPIYQAVRGEPYDSRSPSTVWFETDGGYIHSAFFVPCHEFFQEPEDVSSDGFWGEVAVPISYQHRQPSLASFRYDYNHYKNFWGQVHRVLERAQDDEGRAWYRLYDDIEPKRPAWVQARHIRRILPAEFAPVSPDVTDKRIVINLADQMLMCFEGKSEVFHTRIASGTSVTNETGQEFDFSTNYGTYTVQRKRPSRRMQGGQSAGLPYDLNGVPWVTYFTYTGAAVHGTYWHNNFGVPRSRGCINVTPDAAKWVYRWSLPYRGYEDEYRWTEKDELASVVEIV